MQQFEWVHAAWLGFAIVLEIFANVLLKFSDGFRRKVYGLMSIAAVLGAFSALSQAVKGIDLSVAYALWGGFGIAATLAAGWVLFGQRLNNKGWIGLILLLAGMVMINSPDNPVTLTRVPRWLTPEPALPAYRENR